MTFTGTRNRELPPDWAKRRVAVFQRDSYTCVDCGWADRTGNTLECDHIGRRLDHTLPALATRCGPGSANNCHGKKTAAQGHAARLKLARPKPKHPGLR